MATKLPLLIVDDLADNRALARFAAERDGRFEVVGEAKNGADAVMLAAELSPAAVLLDYMMPVMDGLEALPQMRIASPGATIVLISSAFDGRIAQAAMAAGATAALDRAEGLEAALNALAGAAPVGA